MNVEKLLKLNHLLYVVWKRLLDLDFEKPKNFIIKKFRLLDFIDEIMKYIRTERERT